MRGRGGLVCAQVGAVVAPRCAACTRALYTQVRPRRSTNTFILRPYRTRPLRWYTQNLPCGKFCSGGGTNWLRIEMELVSRRRRRG